MTLTELLSLGKGAGHRFCLTDVCCVTLAEVIKNAPRKNRLPDEEPMEQEITIFERKYSNFLEM